MGRCAAAHHSVSASRGAMRWHGGGELSVDLTAPADNNRRQRELRPQQLLLPVADDDGDEPHRVSSHGY